MGGDCREQLPSLPLLLSVVLLLCPGGQLKLPDVSLKEELRRLCMKAKMSLSVCLLATARVCATKLCLFVLTYKQARTSTVLLFVLTYKRARTINSAVIAWSSLWLVMLQRNIMLFITL